MEKTTLHDEVVRAIIDAYIALLFEKEDKDISISELCAKAGVSRMSFYRSFDTKKAILDYAIKADLLKIYQSASFMDLSIRGPILLQEFQYVYEHAAFLQLLQRRGYLDLLYNAWDYYAKRFCAEKDPTANPYEYAFYAGASINVIIRWIEGGLKESPEQMAQYFDDMIADSRTPWLRRAAEKNPFGQIGNLKAFFPSKRRGRDNQRD
jgi:AcrR family transcriptional regulator